VSGSGGNKVVPLALLRRASEALGFYLGFGSGSAIASSDWFAV
jgi:hypothetical protein